MSWIELSVGEPTKNTDKFSQSYISYKITSVCKRLGFDGGKKIVDRRYSDFCWLYDEFSKEFPGVIIPPLPEKQAVGRFSSEFIEARRRALERFLMRVSDHPILSNSTNFASFLQSEQMAFDRLKDSSKQSKSKSSSTAMAWFEGTVHTLANGKPEMEKSAADIKIDEITQYVSNYERQMSSTLKHSEALVKKNKELSQSLYDLGQVMITFGQTETGDFSKGVIDFGSGVDSVSSITSVNAESEQLKFIEPWDEYYRAVNSIKTALHVRNEKKTSYQNALIDLDAKQAAHRKVANVPGKESQASTKEQAVQTAKDILDAAKLELERVSDRLISEFEEFQRIKAHDLKKALSEFINLQIEYQTQILEKWNTMLANLDSSDFGSGAKDSAVDPLPDHMPPPPPAKPPRRPDSLPRNDEY